MGIAFYSAFNFSPVSYCSIIFFLNSSQFRLTNGSAITGTFKPTDTLSSIVSYVDSNRTDGSRPFALSTTFPKKMFAQEDMEKTLKECGLVPSAVLVLTKQ